MFDWLIDCIYAVSVIFQPCNGGIIVRKYKKVLNRRLQKRGDSQTELSVILHFFGVYFFLSRYNYFYHIHTRKKKFYPTLNYMLSFGKPVTVKSLFIFHNYHNKNTCIYSWHFMIFFRTGLSDTRVFFIATFAILSHLRDTCRKIMQ